MRFMHRTMLYYLDHSLIVVVVYIYIYRLMEQKIDQLTEMTAELTRRFQSWEKRWPFKMGGQ